VIHTSKKIIALDDDSDNLVALKNILKDIYEVYPVINATTMFDLLEHFFPDLILLDVEMPGIHGYEVARKLKGSEQFREIPIIFLTSASDADSEIKGLELGAVDYIHKPFVSPLLLQRIKTHLSLVEHQKVLEDRNATIEKLLELQTTEISLRKKAEIEAQDASRAKGEFLSHMSHEIRTPLNAIIGMLGIAAGTGDIQKIKHCLDKANIASKHMLSIINDILDISKIEANKFELAYDEFDLEKMLISVTNMINIRAEEKHQNFIVKLHADVPQFIICDELRLSQIVTNLLSNAVKFTPGNGLVVLSISKVNNTEDTLTLQFEVADSGIGISEEQQKHLFMSFSQADSRIAGKFGGTGLGLAISKQIVELMQGKIWVESEEGKGSKFIFTIKTEEAENKTRVQLSEKIDRDNFRILVVDNSTDTKEYFAHVMDAYNLLYDTACNEAEAIDMTNNAKDKPYSAFFVSQKIQDTDGLVLTKKIREIAGKKSFVILFSMTGWINIEKDVKSAGVDQCIHNPVFPSSLIRAINECVDDNHKKDIRQDTPEKPNFDFSGFSILVAEDVDINREVLAAVLEDSRLSIDFAENGKIAVSMFRENPGKYHLVLMDVNMPEMDGYEAARIIRALDLPGAKDIPIVAMTANVFREDIEKCLAEGMNDHIGKPIDTDILFMKLKKYLLP
jgi:signal transduction histidine kinase